MPGRPGRFAYIFKERQIALGRLPLFLRNGKSPGADDLFF